MPKNSKRVPPALKHGIYTGIGLLPTESPGKFRKFRKEIFADLNPVGRLETNIVDQIVRLEWRRENFSTYDLAQRARARRASIHSEVVPPVRYLDNLPFLEVPEPVPDPDNPTPQQLRAARRRAEKRSQIELGAALELADVGDVATFEYLDKRLGILNRLDEMSVRAYKKLSFVRAIKSMSPPSLPPPASSPSLAPSSPPLLESPA